MYYYVSTGQTVGIRKLFCFKPLRRRRVFCLGQFVHHQHDIECILCLYVCRHLWSTISCAHSRQASPGWTPSSWSRSTRQRPTALPTTSLCVATMRSWLLRYMIWCRGPMAVASVIYGWGVTWLLNWWTVSSEVFGHSVRGGCGHVWLEREFDRWKSLSINIFPLSCWRVMFWPQFLPHSNISLYVGLFIHLLFLFASSHFRSNKRSRSWARKRQRQNGGTATTRCIMRWVLMQWDWLLLAVVLCSVGSIRYL